MGKLFTTGWYDRVEALIALALAKTAASSSGSSTPWVNVAAGTTITPTLNQQFIAADTAGPGSVVVDLFPTPANGQQQEIRAVGPMAFPVVVNATGPGHTVEQVLQPGNFSSTTTQIAIEGQAISLKFDGATGQWRATVQGPAVSTIALRPLGGALDDRPRFETFLSIAGSAGLSITMLPGLGGEPWVFNSVLAIPSAAYIIGTPSTTMVGTTPDGSILNAPFAMTSIPSAVPASAFHLNNVRGARTVNLVGDPVALSGEAHPLILLLTGSGLSGSVYRVESSVVGGGGFVVTLDRPVLTQFAAGGGNPSSAKLLLSRPENIVIEGNGMTLSGVWPVGVELSCAWRCEVSGLVFDQPAAGYADAGGLTLDVGSAECHIHDNQAQGAFNSGFFWAGESHTIENNLASTSIVGAPKNGHIVSGLISSTLRNQTALGASIIGHQITTDGVSGTQTPSSDLDFDTLIAEGCLKGIVCTRGLTRCNFKGVRSRYNTSNGLEFNNTDGAPSVLTFDGLDVSNNAGHGWLFVNGTSGIYADNVTATDNGDTGINVPAGSTGVKFGRLDVTGNVTGMFVSTTNIRVDDFVSLGGNATSIVNLSGGATLTLDKVTMTTAIVSPVTLSGAGSRLQLRSGSITNTFGAFLINVNAGAILGMDDVTWSGAAGGGISAAAGGIVRIGDNVRFGNLGSPVNVGGGSFWNRSALAAQTVTLPGGAGNHVTVSWTDLQIGDDVIAILKDPNGGTPTPTQVTKVPGTGFTFTATGAGAAADTSKIDWLIR